jgi:hypothetical protein
VTELEAIKMVQDIPGRAGEAARKILGLHLSEKSILTAIKPELRALAKEAGKRQNANALPSGKSGT